MLNNQNILKLTQEQITEVTTELKTLLDNQYNEERQEEIAGLEFICHMPGIHSERTWLFSYKGALVLLYDLGNNYCSYVGCIQENIDNIVKKYAITHPKDSVKRDMAFTDLKYDLEKIKSVKFGGFITVGDLLIREQLKKE